MAGRRLTLDDVAHLPLPGTAVPTGLRFSPSGRWLAWLHSSERTLRRDLFVHDVTTGDTVAVDPPGGGVTEGNLSLEERLRRERQREMGQGVTSFAWAHDADVLLVPLPGGIWCRGWPGGDWVQVASELDGPLLDPQLSPDGSLVAFVHDDEVYVASADGSRPASQVTRGARGTGRSHGLAEFVAQEEMGRSHGLWWSPDGRRIAFAQVDETHIPSFRIAHLGSDDPAEAEEHRYPFAGAANARVRLFAVELDVAGDRADPVELDLGDAEYLARVDWSRDGAVLAQLQDRAQSRLDLVRFDPATGARTHLVQEQSDVWVNLHDHLRPLGDGRFLWASERSGFVHLELRSADGSVDATLTNGDWLVTSVAAVDEDAGLVWCTTTRQSPLERHLEAVPLAGGEARRITHRPGTHACAVSHEAGLFADTFSAVDQPPVVTLHRLGDGSQLRVLFDEPDPRVQELGDALTPPELRTVTARDGETLHVAVYHPRGGGPGGDGGPPAPLVDSLYGGPHVQLVTNSWATTVRLRNQLLAAEGVRVLAVDNRGSANRGIAFEGAVRWNLGDLEVRDHVDAVRAMVEQGLADPDRVGVYGWSYGGYLAAMCLARAPKTFKVAVAGAPVTHWDGYDTHYTERYMGTPAANPDGYVRSAVMAHAGGITGHLLLVHGLIDENVHFRHTARLVNGLIRARVPYELLLYPDERHSPRSEADRVHMEARIRDFLLSHLRS